MTGSLTAFAMTNELQRRARVAIFSHRPRNTAVYF